ncbi:hypothetical protein FOZ62_026933, partial [Perkinsus olseni]
GTHTAMKTGMLAAEAAVADINDGAQPGHVSSKYEHAVKDSWVHRELYGVRNIHPAFKTGLFSGLGYGAFWLMSKGREPWTFRWSKDDAARTRTQAKCKEVAYPKPDGKLTFDLTDQLPLTGVDHEADQPSHLKIKPGMEKVPKEVAKSKTFGFPMPTGRWWEFVRGHCPLGHRRAGGVTPPRILRKHTPRVCSCEVFFSTEDY